MSAPLRRKIIVVPGIEVVDLHTFLCDRRAIVATNDSDEHSSMATGTVEDAVVDDVVLLPPVKTERVIKPAEKHPRLELHAVPVLDCRVWTVRRSVERFREIPDQVGIIDHVTGIYTGRADNGEANAYLRLGSARQDEVEVDRIALQEHPGEFHVGSEMQFIAVQLRRCKTQFWQKHVVLLREVTTECRGRKTTKELRRTSFSKLGSIVNT